jgi:hypothetical protein
LAVTPKWFPKPGSQYQKESVQRVGIDVQSARTIFAEIAIYTFTILSTRVPVAPSKVVSQSLMSHYVKRKMLYNYHAYIQTGHLVDLTIVIAMANAQRRESGERRVSMVLVLVPCRVICK